MKTLLVIVGILLPLYFLIWTWFQTEEGGKHLCDRGRHLMRRDPRDKKVTRLLDTYVQMHCARLCGYEEWVDINKPAAKRTRLRPKVSCPDCTMGLRPDHDWDDCPSCDGSGEQTWKADIA